MSTAHPEFPEAGERDEDLLITEQQQREFLEVLVEVEHDLREGLLDVLSDTPNGEAIAERTLATFTDLAARARQATRNAVTIEERIAHLDFEPGNISESGHSPEPGQPPESGNSPETGQQ